MKLQWTLIFALIFALVVAIFAVFNVDSVPVNFVFGQASLPLILVIIGSALLGGLIVGLFGIIRQYRLQRKIKGLQKELADHAATTPQEVTSPRPDAEQAITAENSTPPTIVKTTNAIDPSLEDQNSDLSADEQEKTVKNEEG